MATSARSYAADARAERTPRSTASSGARSLAGARRTGVFELLASPLVLYLSARADECRKVVERARPAEARCVASRAGFGPYYFLFFDIK
jgi:hypothetical protein